MSLDEIKRMVADLSSDQIAEFREWFRKLDLDQWDQQIEQDIKAGKLEHLSNDAIREMLSGETKPL